MGALCRISLKVLLIVTFLAAQNGDNSTEDSRFSSILEKHSDVPEARFNAGYEAYQNGDLDHAQEQFQSAVESGNEALRFPALYNLGNTLYSKSEQAGNSPSAVPQTQPFSYEEAVDAYRKALTLNSADDNAKHNYELALKKMLEQPPQQQDQQQNQSGENSEDQENQDQQQDNNNQNEQQEQSQQSPEQQKKSEKEEQVHQQSNPQEMNKTEERPDSEAILDALRAQEKLQPRLFVDKAKSKKPEKDW